MGKHVYDIIEEKGWSLDKRDTISGFVGNLYIEGQLFANIYSDRFWVINKDIYLDSEKLSIIRQLQDERAKQEIGTTKSNFK